MANIQPKIRAVLKYYCSKCRQMYKKEELQVNNDLSIKHKFKVTSCPKCTNILMDIKKQDLFVLIHLVLYCGFCNHVLAGPYKVTLSGILNTKKFNKLECKHCTKIFSNNSNRNKQN